MNTQPERTVVTFEGTSDFEAMYAAEKWCLARGISVASTERGAPRGLMFGQYSIAKWRNLSHAERAELHGVMTGRMRNGPVTVTIYRMPTVGSTP